MTTKTTKKGTRSLALAIAFAVALSLFGGILFAPEAYAETTTVTWDSSVLSTFDEGDTEQSSQGITFNRTEFSYIYQSLWGPAMWFSAKDSTSFSSSNGDIKNITISASDVDLDSMNLGEGWKCENNIFTWSGTPADNVVFLSGVYGDITLESIVFVTEKPHEHNSLVKTDKVEPTCDQDGHEAYWTCTVCNKMFSDAEGKNQISSPIIIPTKHTLVKTDKVEPTCYQDGHEAYWTCSECYRMFSDSEGRNEISNPITIPARHTLVKTNKVEPTCTRVGYEAYWTCSECFRMFSDSEGKNEISNPITIPAKGHDWGEWFVTQEPTITTRGFEKRICNNDNHHIQKRNIPQKTPNYAVNNMSLNAGLKVTQSGSKITVKFGKVSDATYYEVFVSYYGKSPELIKTTKNKISITKLNGKKLNLKKVFKVYVVAKINNIKLGQSINAYVAGKNAKLTNAKKVKLAKSGATLKVGKTSKIKATTIPENPKKKVLSLEGEYRYASNNTKVATVNKKGKITAKHKGTCYIYVFANNGYAAKVKVNVK